MLRTGVLGVGHMGWLHARTLRSLPAFRLAAVCDRDAARAERAAGEFGARAVEGLDAIAELCEAVVIAVPTHDHHDLVTAALERGLHVFVEKPLAASPEEGSRLVERAARTDRVAAVGHVERFNPAFRAIARDAARPLFVEAHRLAPFVPRSIDVDVIADLMIHDLDLLLAVHPEAPESVHASGVPVLTGREDIANARIAFADGAVANLTASRVSRERMRRIRFFLPKAYVSVDLLARTGEIVRLAADPREWLARGEVPPASALLERRAFGPFPDANPIADELEDFARACTAGSAPSVGFDAAQRALELAATVRARVSEHVTRIRARGSARPAP